MKRLSVFVIMLLCLAGCGKGETGKTTDQEILLNPAQAEYDEAISGALRSFKDKSFKELARHYWFDSKKPKYIMLFAKPGNGSHVSGAEIGGFFAEYNGESKKWEIKARATSFAENGSWGEAPQPRFVKLGPDKYGFIMEPGFLGQGYASNVLFVYGIVGNNFVKLLSMPTYSDNSGTGLPDSYQVKVSLYQVFDGKKEFYDLKAQLQIDGTYSMEPGDEYAKIFGASKEAKFTYKDGVYSLAGKR